ncbi:hypothetical protein FI667_g3635, partial [Globisporangium splendens]
MPLLTDALERMLHIYRTWTNVPGVEGGFALTRDELECVLEYPPAAGARGFPVCDVPDRGSLEAKAEFIFSLVDLDLEDDLVEEELALVVSTCSNGLQRLGVHSETLLELDALAIAYEAFGLVGVEDGGKMSFPLFLKWCVFHERPRALFERISSLFSMSNVAVLLHEMLQQQRDLPLSSPFHRYNAIHFGEPNEEVEQVAAVVGPIIGKITSSSVTLLLEVDRPATVEVFAFVLGSHGNVLEAGAVIQLHLSQLKPEVVAIQDLQPGTTYASRLLGVKREHRNELVAYATTLRRNVDSLETDTKSPKWTMRVINHRSSSSSVLTSFDQTIYSKATDLAATLLAQCYRDLLTRKELVPLLRYQANLFCGGNDDILFGSDREARGSLLDTVDNEMIELLAHEALSVWKRYIGDLWGLGDGNQHCVNVDGSLLVLPVSSALVEIASTSRPHVVLCLFSFVARSLKTQTEPAVLAVLKAALDAYPEIPKLVLVTANPVLPIETGAKREAKPSAAAQLPAADVNNDQAPLDMQWRWTLLETLVDWQRASLTRSALLLSCGHHFGYQSTVGVKNTMLHLSQYVCGPLRGITACADQHSDDAQQLQLSHSSRLHDNLTVRHGSIEYRPHYVFLAAEYKLNDRRMQLTPTTRILHPRRVIRPMVGPIVGWVTSDAASILLECDEEAEILCVLTERITGNEFVVVQRTGAQRPVFFRIGGLRPGQIYDVTFQGLSERCEATFQTPFAHIPSCTLVVVADDACLNGKWTAIHTLLSHNEPPRDRSNKITIETKLRLLVILCDAPIVWHDAEPDAKTLWHRSSTAKTQKSAPSFLNNAWSLYPQERARLLNVIFRRLETDPAFHATILCTGGSQAARTFIRDPVTGRQVEQIVLGSVSCDGSSQLSLPRGRMQQKGTLDGTRYVVTHEVSTSDGHPTTSPEYGILDLVAHPRGSTSAVRIFMHDRPDARILVGPVIGCVTLRSARILLELGRSAEKCTCVLVDRVTSQRYVADLPLPTHPHAPFLTTLSLPDSFATERSVDAFSPTIFKMEALHPASRYLVSIEGILASETGTVGYLETPPLLPLASEWIVVQRNLIGKFIGSNNASSWRPIVASGMRSYTAVSSATTYTRNGDTLGESLDVNDPGFNPWFHVEDAFLSEPMKTPQLVVHLGGQIDLRRAFPDTEVLALMRRLGTAANPEDDGSSLLIAEVRHRMQEVYRVTWGMPPWRQMLAHSSNLMLLNEEFDLFFSTTRLQAMAHRYYEQQNGESEVDEPHPIPTELSDAHIERAAILLRRIAFELWQRYQNQLWIDLHDRDLENAVADSTKFAFTTTFGSCRMVFLNVSDAVHTLRSSQVTQEHGESAEVASSLSSKKTAKNKPTALTSDSSSLPPLSVFTNATWKTLEDALLPPSSSEAVNVPIIQQLVVVIPADFVAWTKQFPQVCPDWVRVLDKCFAWKAETNNSNRLDHVQREVTIICSSDHGSPLSLTLTDEKMNKTLALSCVGSISEPRDLIPTRSGGTGPTAAKAAVGSRGDGKTPLIKGYFSKRYTYQSTLLNRSGTQQQRTSSMATSVKSRTFASYQYVSEYRTGSLHESLHYFPPKTSPKATLGPIVGRIFLRTMRMRPTQEDSHQDAEHEVDTLKGDNVHEDSVLEDTEDEKVRATVLILLEINANATVTCVVTDSLLNEDVRVEHAMVADRPHVFCIEGLLPERRYVYRFEGISNSATRRGCFHTPLAAADERNVIALSSHLPAQMEHTQASLWVAILERVRVPWCGIDAILHLGGQVPVREAAVECFQWLRREGFQTADRRKSNRNDRYNDAEANLRRKVRKRFQQHYHLTWNFPSMRELLANVSNWFTPSQADVAPFFKSQSALHTKAAQLVLDVAQEVVGEYQAALMYPPKHQAGASNADTSEEPHVHPGAMMSPVPPPLAAIESKGSETKALPRSQQSNPVSPAAATLGGADRATQKEDTKCPATVDDSVPSTSSPEPERFVQHGDIGFFFCDMRRVGSVGDDEKSKITCNNRLATPLRPQEHPVIDEAQWLQLEHALKKKKLLLFVLCLEFPLILTSAEHVTQLRDALASSSSQNLHDDEAKGTWLLYDHKALHQHWVACPRQLEQLLQLLFKWKAKRSGRDVLLLSGGTRVGLDTLLHDRESKLALRNLTCGPITANVEPFEFALNGVACPMFGGNDSAKDDRFTFSHSPMAKKNYVWTQLAITTESLKPLLAASSTAEASNVRRIATVDAAFIVNEPDSLRTLHPIHKSRRFPSWWKAYVPMGAMVFWDDTILLKSESSDDMRALAAYVYEDRSLAAALELFYETHQFAETARLAELQSRQSVPLDVPQALRDVVRALWQVIPDAKRRCMASFVDPFVMDTLLVKVAPALFSETKKTLSDGAHPPAIELAAFMALCREFVFSACLLHRTTRSYREDDELARQRAREERNAHIAREIEEKRVRDAALADEQTRLEQLRVSDPEQYAKILLANEAAETEAREAKKRTKLERKKADKLRELEEERAIAKEQKRLNALAESPDAREEYARRQHALETRIRKLNDRKQQQLMEKQYRQQEKLKQQSAAE